MKKPVLILSVLTVLFLSGCVSMAPVSNSFESAKTLEKKQIEIMGSYSADILRAEDDNGDMQSDKSNNNIGLRLGYGLGNRLDLKFRYERLLPVIAEDKEVLDGVNFFGLCPRYALIKDKLTGGLELGLYTYRIKETTDMDSYNDSEFAISPKLAFSFPPNRNFDVTLSTKLDFFTSGGGNLWHMNLGFGISSDAAKWDIRPEIGLIKDLENFSAYTWYTAGVAFILRISPHKE